MHFLIFSGGDFTPSLLTKKAIDEADVIIAADHGADTALRLGIFPSVVVGDLDSISPETKNILEKKKALFIAFEKEKDETDTELAMQYALTNSATGITLLGGLAGNRFDHVMGNLLLATTTNVPLTFINGNQLSWIGKGPYEKIITGEKGDLLSLIPLSSTIPGITTEGLYYPLKNEPLYFGKPRGISNVFTQKEVTISFTDGVLLITHTFLAI